MNQNLEILIESFKENHPKTKDDRPDSIYEALQFLSYIESLNEATTATEYCARNYYVECALNKIRKSIVKENTFTWPYSVAPYFTPEEIDQFKGYYSETTRSFGDKTIFHDIEYLKDELRNTEDPDELHRIKSEIDRLSSYSGESEELIENASISFHRSDWDAKSWHNKIIELETKLKGTEDPEEIDRIKQSLADLGWNPEIEYNTENQIKAKKRIESIYQERYKNILSLDITSLVEAYNETEEVIYEASNDDVKPIHVVIVKGDSTFSHVISTVTKSEFSHAAICIDNDFNNLYSFNLLNGVNKAGGFSIEKVDEYPKENRLAVFSFFVSKEDHVKISERVKMLADNVDKTFYGALNILTLPFKHINLNLSNSMICSQFVDSLLKIGKINITNKDSSHVVPNDFYKAANNNTSGKIYKVFDGITKNFNSKKVVNYIKRMAKKVKPAAITEGSSSELLCDYLYPVVMEAKFPIEFNKDGDVLLTNPFVDFDREYSASHKLLLQYAKVNNLEGMKYELARLYYMNYILERRLYHNKSLSKKENNIKTRARVLNDFNKYIEYVLDKEPNFNFSEYYEKSIFYPHTVEVKAGTLLKLKDIIKHIL